MTGLLKFVPDVEVKETSRAERHHLAPSQRTDFCQPSPKKIIYEVVEASKGIYEAKTTPVIYTGPETVQMFYLNNPRT